MCHIASGDRWAGAESQLASLLAVLARNGELVLYAILLNEGRLADAARQAGVKVLVLPETQMSLLTIYSKAAVFLKGKNVRILHSHRYKENVLAAILASRCKIPHVVRTQHGLPESFHGIDHYKHLVIQGLDRMVARFATDRILAVSDEMRNKLVHRLDPEKVVLIRNGICLDHVQSNYSSSGAKKHLGIPEDCHLVGTAGRLEPIKRLDLFLAAAKRIAAAVGKARFAIVGDGGEKSKLQGITRAFGIEDRVLFLGYREDIYDVLRAMDVFVLCSDHEGLPMVLLEGLFLGLPVVARAVGGIPEVVQDGENGLLVNSENPDQLADACVRLLLDSELRKRLERNGSRNVAEGFSVETTGTKVASLYLQMCGAE